MTAYIRHANYRRASVFFLVLISLGGCATSQKELLPVPDGRTMHDVWDDKAGASAEASAESDHSIKRSRSMQSVMSRAAESAPALRENIHYSRNVTNEINSQFVRLPNPDLVIYIFPHLVGSSAGEQVPVPGYSTIFPLYAQPKYAMPGEVSLPRGQL